MATSLRSRLLWSFLLPALLLFGVAGLGAYVVTRGILEEELGRSLSAIAASAATQVRGGLLLEVEPDDDQGEGTNTFRNLLRRLTEVQEASRARRVFAFDAQGRMRVDSSLSLPVGAEVPELARDRLELARVFAGETVSSQVLFEGTDGRLYKTGYAPVWRDREVVGAIGVEGSAEFFGPLRWLFRAYAVLVVSALLLLGVVAVLTSRAMAAPLNRLVQSALRIGGGDLHTPVPGETLEEIGILAGELEEMRVALASRDEQLKMMLAGVAHEVRNPIGGIELFSGLLAEELNEPEARRHLEHIQKETAYLKRIVEDFLSFAREEKLSLEPLQPAQLLDEAQELMLGDAQQKQVDLQLLAEPGSVEADQSLLLSAIVNLVKNAVQASPAGTAVQLSGRVVEDRYHIEVVDHGGGIPPELQQQIFQPFFTTREKGTGLGLPLAQKIIHAHRGRLTVLSAPGRTTFRIDLPQRR